MTDEAITTPADTTHADGLRTAVQKAMTQGLSQSRVARESGVSAGAISTWMKRTYKGDSKSVEAKLQKWLSTRQKTTEITVTDVLGFVDTPTSNQIENGLFYAQSMSDIAVIYGGAGVGKTSALRHYRETRPNVWVVTMSPDTAPPAAALEEIAEATGLRGLPGRAARLKREIVQRLRGTKGLLVLDEAQHLTVAALECIRSIHDATGVGLALVGNEMVYSRLTGGNRAATFAQLFSRIGKRLHLVRPSDDDVEMIALQWGVVGREERALLAKIAITPGALRSVVKTLRLASVLSLGDGSALCLKYLNAAWRDLGGRPAGELT